MFRKISLEVMWRMDNRCTNVEAIVYICRLGQFERIFWKQVLAERWDMKKREESRVMTLKIFGLNNWVLLIVGKQILGKEI